MGGDSRKSLELGLSPWRKEFLLARNRELGRKYGVEYAEAFHYIGPDTSRAVEDYVRDHAVPLGFRRESRRPKHRLLHGKIVTRAEVDCLLAADDAGHIGGVSHVPRELRER